jgi:hypothetical protein
VISDRYITSPSDTESDADAGGRVCIEMKRTAMTLITALCFAAAVLHLVSGQVRPIFNANSYTGSEGGFITGHLVISGLSREGSITSGCLVYCIEAFKGINDRGLATYDRDYAFETGKNITGTNITLLNTTEVKFFPNRDASTPFIILLFRDDLHEGDENFFLRFRFKTANGSFLGAFQYQDSAANFEQECTIIDDDGIVIIYFTYDMMILYV